MMLCDDDDGLAGTIASRTSYCIHNHRKIRRHLCTATSVNLLIISIITCCYPSLATAATYDADHLSQLINQARSSNGHAGAELWHQVLEIDPKNGEAHLQMGLHLTVGDGRGNDDVTDLGMTHLERVLDGYPTIDEPSPLQPNTPQRFVLSNFVGRYRWQMKEYGPAKKYLEMSFAEKPDDACTQAMVASLIDVFPLDVEAADDSLKLYHERMDLLIRRAADTSENTHEYFLEIDPRIVSMVPVLAEDPYTHCLMSLFYHSFYYRDYVSVASAHSKHFEVASAMFPELLYTSPFVTKRRLATRQMTGRTKVKRKIRLGVASGFMTEGSSVSADFGGVLSHLDRNIFDVTYIYFAERPGALDKAFDSHHGDFRITIAKDDQSTGGYDTRHAWLQRAHAQVSKLDLDVLYFLDTTMSSHVHRFAMAKVAPVQVVSHGHPITSGIPRDIMNYYISWAGAELDYDVAQEHYTEELKLLPADKIHQYYEKRITEDGRSVQDNMPFRHLVEAGREEFFSNQIPADGHWYLCMQKPFKLHPEFDKLVSGILQKDPKARILLHQEDRPSNHRIFVHRLENAGCDNTRVHFVPVQPHHRLLALYELSDVVLDSYPAGGCTTTREVFEVGKPVVTLPARYLGSRWSFALYNILGDDELTKAVVASSEEEYVDLAVRLGTDESARRDAERRVRKSVGKLFRRWEAVEEWTKMLLEIAPVEFVGDVVEGDDDDSSSRPLKEASVGVDGETAYAEYIQREMFTTREKKQSI